MVSMKKLALLLMFAPLCVYAQTGVLQGHCYLGGKQATTSGMNSSNYMDGNIPACTVTVYLTGTLTKQTITKPDGSALANPFTANTATAVDPGGWIFRAATNQGLDVVMSGGNSNPSCITAPLCYTQPVTLTDVFPSQSFSPQAGVNEIIPGTNINCTPFSGGNCQGNVTLNVPTATASLIGASRPDNSTVFINSGVLSTNTSASLAMAVAAAGITNYIVIHPTGNSCSAPSGAGSACNNTSALLTWYCTGVLCNTQPNTTGSWTFTGATLPVGVTASNVTAVYGYSTSSGFSGVDDPITATFACNSSFSVLPTPIDFVWPMQTAVSGTITGATGSNFQSITCNASLIAGGAPGPSGITLTAPDIGLILALNISPPAVSPTPIFVSLPLTWNSAISTLGLNLPDDAAYDTGSTGAAYIVSVPSMQLQPGASLKFAPAHNSSSTTPTLNLNGYGAITITNSRGGALTSGDIVTTQDAHVILDPTSPLTWALQNPQVSVPGGGTTTNALTMNNSGSGAASGTTFNGGVAETISYNTVGAPGISGSPTTGHCVDWASASTLGDTGSACGSSGGGVTQITGPGGTETGALTFTGAGVSNIGTTFTFSGAAGGVLYPASTTNFVIMGDSRAAVTTSCAESSLPSDAATITATSVTSGTATFTATNTYTTGCVLTLSSGSSDFSSCTALKGQIITVLSTGLSTSQFEATVTGGCSGSVGTGSSIPTYNLTGYLSREPYVNGAPVTNYSTSSQTLALANTAYATHAHTLSPAVTGKPGWLILEDWAQDLYNGRTLAQMEADYTTLLGTARTDWTAANSGIICTTIPSPTGIASGSAVTLQMETTWIDMNKWIQSMGPTSANVTAGKWCDRIVPLDDMIPSGYDAQYINQTGGAIGHFTDLANSYIADAIIQAISNPKNRINLNKSGDIIAEDNGFPNDVGSMVGVKAASGTSAPVIFGRAMFEYTSSSFFPFQGFWTNTGSGGAGAQINSLDSVQFMPPGYTTMANMYSSNAAVGWGSSNALYPNCDTSISRNAATVVQVGNCTTTGLATGTLDAAVHQVGAITQQAASNTGGTCAMSSSTSCTITIGHTYTTPVCIATQQSATLTGGAVGCTVSGTTVTITATTANSETWGAFVFGNPN